MKTIAVATRPARACRLRDLRSKTRAEAPLAVLEASAEAWLTPAEREAVVLALVDKPVSVNGSEAEVETAVDTGSEEMSVPFAAAAEGGTAAALPRYVGAGDALLGSDSAPVPNLIPSACVSGGSTVFPLASAMAKRPVQVRFVGAAGEEN